MHRFAIWCVILALPLIYCYDGPTVTTPELVARHGYPLENHTVETSDGYILTMHRIPWSRLQTQPGTGDQRPVAFVMHGLLCSSADWVLLGPGKSLAYSLSDAGYDVWLGNARGNTYSKKHKYLSPLLQAFWDFSWHEIAIYDLPAMIDYAINLTQTSEIRYFGHSQGTTTFLILNSLLPKYNSLIRSGHLLAPVAYMSHMENALATVGAPLLGDPNAFVEVFGSAEFLPNSELLALLGEQACKDNAPTQDICENVIFLIYGWDSPFLNKTAMPEILTIDPAGSSVNQIMHYLQEYNSGYFRQFDYGFLRNLFEYGKVRPPSYPVHTISTQIFTYYSDNDALASVIDVEHLHEELNPASLAGTFELPTGWNHLDHLFAENIQEHLYDKVLEDVNNS